MKQKVSSWILLIFCLYLTCSSIAIRTRNRGKTEDADVDSEDQAPEGRRPSNEDETENEQANTEDQTSTRQRPSSGDGTEDEQVNTEDQTSTRQRPSSGDGTKDEQDNTEDQKSTRKKPSWNKNEEHDKGDQAGHGTGHEQHEIQAFAKPGLIVPGLKFSNVMKLFANMYNGDTIKDGLREACKALAPVLSPLVGEEIVDQACKQFLQRIRPLRYETSDICMEVLSDMIAHEQVEHPYSGEMGNPGFDDKHDDGLHFDFYDQHQDMYAAYMEGMPMNHTDNSKPRGHGHATDQHFSPEDLLMGSISMFLMDIYGSEIPRHIIEPIIAETFELNPKDPSDVCNTVGDTIFNKPGTVRDWMENGFSRVILFLARITPLTCKLAQEKQQQESGSDFNGHQESPEISIGPIIEGMFKLLGEYNDTPKLCEKMVPKAEQYADKPDKIDKKVAAMTGNLLAIVENAQVCGGTVAFIDSVFASFGMEGSVVAPMMGFETDQELCIFVLDVFSPESTLNQEIDISRFMFQGQDYQSPNGNPVEHQSLPFDEAMKVAGRIYNAGNLREGFSEFCNIFDQAGSGQIYDILGLTISNMCTNGQDAGSWTDMCRAHIEGYGSHGGDEQRYEDHGTHEHGDPMMTLYDHNSPLHGVLKLLAARYGLFDIMNPYSICDTAIDALTIPMPDLVSLGKEIATLVLAKLFETDFPSTLCAIHGNAPSGHSDEAVPDPEFDEHEGHGGEESGSDGEGSMEPSVEDLLQVIAFAANVDSHAEFCELITTVSGTASDHEIFLKQVATRVVDRLFLIISESKTCNAVFDVVFGMSPEMAQYFTGFQSASDFCKKIINPFKPKNKNELQLPEINRKDMSILMELEEEPFQNPGQIFSFLSVESVIQAMGKLYNQNTPLVVVRLLCENYGSVLSQIPDAGQEISEVCRLIDSRDVDQLRSSCYNIMVPLLFGPEHPIALRTINVPFILAKILFPIVGKPVTIDEENICQAHEEFTNSDLSIRDVVDQVLDGVIPILVDYGNDVCNQLSEIKNYLQPKAEHMCYEDYNGQMVAWNGVPCEEFIAIQMKRFQEMFTGMLRIASTVTGFKNERSMCMEMTKIVKSGSSSKITTLNAALKQQIYSFISNDRKCYSLLEQIQRMAEFGSTVPEEVRRQIHHVTGFRTTEALCIEGVRLMNGEEKQVCRGIVDCAGVCNGKAVKDCRGECMGPAVEDCAGVCRGDAYVNECGFCVHGKTRRKSNFGTDKCGICIGGEDYRITFDCHGTCSGSAVYDKCGECVGGKTKRKKHHNAPRIDCRGLCDGGWVSDQCGYCNPPPKGKTEVDPAATSKYMDCYGTCHRPGTRLKSMSHLNECGECVGGTTGLPETEGMNACDQCFNSTDADPTSCIGCDGVPKSGKEIDACGDCGGTGTACVGASAVFPRAIQENSLTNLVVHGAGFSTRSTLKCVFRKSDGSSKTFVVIKKISTQEIVCKPSLAAGTYDVTVDKDGFVSEDVSTTLVVYEDIPMVEVTPTDVDLDGETFDMYVTADDGAFTALKEIATPYIIAESNALRKERFLYKGQFSADSDSELQFLGVPIPPRSMLVNVWVSLDGINKLSADRSDEAFQVKFWAEEPMFESLKLDSNGASLTANFDLRVEYKQLKSCDAIFEDTTKLGRGAKCVWKGPTRLKIVTGKGDNLIGVGDELTLKEGAVRTFKQEYSYTATGSQAVAGPKRAVQVRARLRGTERITSCGKVKMTARKSKGGAGRKMTYAWSVTSSGDVSAINTLLSGYTEADLVFDGTLLEAETIYTFEMTATNFMGMSDTDFIEVSRSATATPEVIIIPRGVDITNALVSERFKLTAEVTFYSDCVPPGKTVFVWSVDNDNVPLNLRTINRRTLYVDSNTLPGNENLTFTITIYKESDPEKYINQSITVATSFSELQTVIGGGNEMTIGRDAGNVTIDGTASFDPDNVAMNMTYEWLCEQVTDDTACWSYKEGEEGQLVLRDDASTQSVLQFDALAMQPEKTYSFTLMTSKGSRSSTASVNVLAMNGDPPRVKIQPIQGKIRNDRVFKLRSKIRHTSTLAGIEWTTANTEASENAGEDEEAFAYLDLADEANLVSASSLYKVDNTHSVSFLGIKPGKLTPGSSYMFQLNVTTLDGLFGLAKVDVHILAEVTSCAFGLSSGVNEYTELDKVEMLVADCAADETAYPLSYQIFLEKEDGSLEAFTERQSEPLIVGVGKPAREGTSSNTFVAKVCDNFGGCTSFMQEFVVTTKNTFTEEEAHELKATLVDEEKFKQNYVAALVNYNTISEKVDISFNSTTTSNNSTGQGDRRRRAAAEVTSAQAAEQLELMELVLANTVMDTATAQLQIDQLSAFTVTDMTLVDQDRLLDIISQLVSVFTESDEETISESSVDAVLNITLVISQDLDPADNAQVLLKIEEIDGALSLSRLGELVVGGAPVETVTDTIVSTLQLAIPSGVFYSKSAGGAPINFGSDISSRFGADWTCSTGSCSGVAIHYDHFDTATDKISTTDEDKNARAADIISISILDPASGEEIVIEDLADPISITMTLTMPKSNSYYECTSWNHTTEEWSTEGLVTAVNSSTEVKCLSTHLSEFTVMAQTNPTTEMPELEVAVVTDAPEFTVTTELVGDGDKKNKKKSSVNIGAVLGGVIGGVAAIVGLSLLYAYVYAQQSAAIRQLNTNKNTESQVRREEDREMQPVKN